MEIDVALFFHNNQLKQDTAMSEHHIISMMRLEVAHYKQRKSDVTPSR